MSTAKLIATFVGVFIVAAAASSQAKETYYMAPAGGSPILQNKLHSQLGDSWTVEKQGTSLVCERKMAMPASPDLQKKVNDAITSLQKDYKDIVVRFDGSQVYFSGWTKDCNNLVSQAKEFSKFDGVNRISIDTSCGSK